MSHVFISYAHEDSRRAGNLAKALELSRIPVWWDPKIRLGEPFPPAIDDALEAAAAIVVLWSRASIGSRWVIQEAEVGVRRGVLVPVLLDQITPPSEFAYLDCANLVDWEPQEPHREFDQLRRRLLSLFPSRAGRMPRGGDWQAERLNKETLLVRLDHEQHTVQYSKGHLFVDGELTQQGAPSIVDERVFRFELSDGPERYLAQLDVTVTLFRGDVKRLALKVGGAVLYQG